MLLNFWKNIDKKYFSSTKYFGDFFHNSIWIFQKLFTQNFQMTIFENCVSKKNWKKSSKSSYEKCYPKCFVLEKNVNQYFSKVQKQKLRLPIRFKKRYCSSPTGKNWQSSVIFLLFETGKKTPQKNFAASRRFKPTKWLKILLFTLRAWIKLLLCFFSPPQAGNLGF